MFTKDIKEVIAPEAGIGQTVTILCSGKPKVAIVTRISVYPVKFGRSTYYTWMYHLKINESDISVARWKCAPSERLFEES